MQVLITTNHCFQDVKKYRRVLQQEENKFEGLIAFWDFYNG